MPRIVAFSGSTRRASYNAKLVTLASDLAVVAGADVDLLDLGAYALPIYNGDYEEQHGAPVAARELAERLATADGLMIATPEYNGGPSALLKNTIDWISRVDRTLVRDRPIGLLGTSPGGRGASRGLTVVSGIFEWMRASIHEETFSLPHAGDSFDGEHLVADERVRLEQWVLSYVKAVDQFGESG